VSVIYSQQTAFDLRFEIPVWIRRRMQMAKVSDPAQVPPRTMEGTKGWKVIDELKPQAGDIVFKKHRPSAFIAMDLDLMLRNRGIQTVVLTGVSTEGGVEGTARHGVNLGYYMVVVRDAVGSLDREGHDLALRYMENTFDVVDSKQILSIWGKSG
jgi:nicotinamidase-related amidase